MDKVYQKLAERLDAIPNGFPATESGVELRLLAWMYTRQEAELAAVMRVQREPADDIAERAGVAPAIDTARAVKVEVNAGTTT